MSKCPEPEHAVEPRVNCYRCLKPADRCLCGVIERVVNRTGIIVLQHRHEQFHALGTVRIAKLGLEQVAIHVANGADQRGMFHPVQVPPRTGLLFPSESARDLEDVPAEERPEHLVVLDGTWSQVKGLYRDNPWLHELPHYKLSPDTPSRYRIRTEPAAHCLSTIESIAFALTVLEPETTGIPGLVAALDTMIDQQTDCIPDQGGRLRKKRKRQGASRRVPAVLTAAPERVVVVYGESVQQRVRHNVDAPELFQWTAVRIETGDVFECFVQPARGMPSAHHFGLMEMEEREVSPIELDEFRDRWRRWLGADGVVAAWDQSSLQMIEHAMGGRARVVHLKSSYCNLRTAHCGSLAEVLVAEGVEPSTVRVVGRAARRLGRTLAVTAWLRAMASGGD